MELLNKTIKQKEFKEVFEGFAPESVVFFNANWSLNSRKIMKVFEQIEKDEYRDISYFVINAEKYGYLIKKLGIKCLPAILVIKNKKIISKLEGIFNREDILEII